MMNKRKMSGSIMYLTVLGLLFFGIGLLTAIKSGFSPSDIGDLLAGAATLVGVLAAYLAAQKWKEQKNHDMQMAFYKEFFEKVETLRSHLHRHIPALESALEGEFKACSSKSPEHTSSDGIGVSDTCYRILTEAIHDFDKSIGSLRESECWVAVFAGNGEPVSHINKLIDTYRVLYQVLTMLQKGMDLQSAKALVDTFIAYVTTLNSDLEEALAERYRCIQEIAPALYASDQDTGKLGLGIIVTISEIRLDKIVRDSIEMCAYNMGLEQQVR